MSKFSLTPITPIALEVWKQVRGFLKPILLAAPLMVNAEVDVKPLSSLHMSQIQSDTRHNLSENCNDADALIENLSMILVSQSNAALALLDIVINDAVEVAGSISEDELYSFGNDSELVSRLGQYLIQYEKTHSNNVNFIKAIEQFSSKVNELYLALYASKYKEKADEVIIARSYQDRQSVGYTFDPSHSFDDFKKALLG